jgi:hypothetical protein
MSTVLISDPRGFNTQRVPITGVSRSWIVGGSGSLSAEVLSSDLVTAGLNDELRGHWIVIEDDDAGTWGGIVSDVQPNGDGTTEVAASSFEAALDAIRMPRKNRPLYGMPGTVALEAISASVRGLGNPIQVRTADDFGLPVSFAFTGGDLRQALDSMADEAGQEWWVDPDTLTFHWGRKGTDLTGTIQVSEGRHVADWRLPTSLDPVINDLQAYPLNERYQAMQTITVTNPASITAVGRRQGSAGIPGGSHAIHIRNRAIGTVNELAALGQAIEFDLLNVDGAFRWFREGDTICVLLPSISVQLAVRVMGRTLDDTRVMGCSGIVTDRRAVA